MTLAFLGLGRMGEPMAQNLLRGGIALTVWNRSPESAERLQTEGAQVAISAAEALRGASAVILMFANAGVIDTVLQRGEAGFAGNVSGRLIIAMGTTAPEYSRRLEAEIHDAGGRYAECPVSGSRKPAEEATLVAMLAGAADAVEQSEPLVRPMCRAIVRCGAVPNALVAKLSVNAFLITMVAGLAESATFAAAHGMDLQLLRQILDAGPMASDVSRVKLAKLVEGDFTAQASIEDVLMNSRLITAAARDAHAAMPLMQTSEALLEETCGLGLAGIDMIGIAQAIAARSAGDV